MMQGATGLHTTKVIFWVVDEVFEAVWPGAADEMAMGPSISAPGARIRDDFESEMKHRAKFLGLLFAS
jgi:hypothetical protein